MAHGMPLGGISTGFLDVDTDGAWGMSTLFNSGVPVSGPLRLPFLGINVDGRTWVLTRKDTVGTGNAQEIHYWGHYPIVDIEYETTAPVSSALRAWAPFIPGDAVRSNTPAAVFEVHLRNNSPQAHQVTLALTFPGPTQAEAQISPDSPRQESKIDWFPVSDCIAQGVIPAHRQEFSTPEFQGLAVSSEKGTGYVLGVIGKEKTRFGSTIGRDGYDFSSGQEWAAIHHRLPSHQPGSSGNSLGWKRHGFRFLGRRGCRPQSWRRESDPHLACLVFTHLEGRRQSLFQPHVREALQRCDRCGERCGSAS